MALNVVRVLECASEGGDLGRSASAAVGQFILCRRDAWLDSGGHAGFRDSMHDGVKMPRAFRESGHATDLFDGTDLVSCRMYRGFRETWAGFAKNAYEGLDMSPWLRTYATIRDGDLKYVRASDGDHALYDLKADPGELDNLLAKQAEEQQWTPPPPPFLPGSGPAQLSLPPERWAMQVSQIVELFTYIRGTDRHAADSSCRS